MGAFLPKNSEIDWSNMSGESVLPDIRRAIADSKKNLGAIKEIPDHLLTFENCVRALDVATIELDRAWGLANHLENVADTPELRSAVNSAIPEVSEFESSILLDDDLYNKVLTYSNTVEGKTLKGAKARLLKETLDDFRSNGAGLPKDKKDRLREIDKLLKLKTQKFSENTLDATDDWKLFLYDDSDVSGLPEYAKDVAAKKASEYVDSHKGEFVANSRIPKYIITLAQPSMTPFMRYADNIELRRKVYEAFGDVGRKEPWNNENIMPDILKLRHEMANILGFKNFSDYVLERRMAKNGENAEKFIENLREKFYLRFGEEWDELKDFAVSNGYIKSGEEIEPHSALYLRQKLREKKYDFNFEELRPYFEASSVMSGVFKVSARLYGLRIVKKPRGSFKAWNQDVDMFEMFRDSGKGEKLIGVFYTDLHPRKGKRAGAWMNMLLHERGKDPNVGVIAGNFSEPTSDSPALLSYDDVETLFHEFGHLVHFFMMDSAELGLRDVAWDFVELPSQIMENWCKNKECLDLFARHWKTGELIPEDMFKKFDASRKFMAANFAMRQLSYSKVDLAIHNRPEKFWNNLEEEAERELVPYRHKYAEPLKSILPHFTHVFDEPIGYAAGYYSYKWAEVLSADAFTRFKKEGILNPVTGADFADKILRVGDEIPPEDAFKNFMGRSYNTDALVRETLSEK